ncbi:MAG: DUF2079 domain-containing protein [Halothiobacillaceae bacterium]
MKALLHRSILLPSCGHASLLLVAGIVHFLFLLFLGLTRHWGYLTSAFDLGIYDQSLWGLIHGVPFLSTANEFDLPINRLGVHFNPILALFAPLYAIYPAAEWLILIQALSISITAWPLYLLGLRLLRSDRAALLWALAYLFNPFVLSAAAWDFHPVVLAAPLMALAVLSIELKHARLFLLCCFLLLLVREHYGIALVGFGALWWLRQRTVLPAVAAVGGGVIGFALVLGVVMPSLSPTGSHVMMSQELGQLSRYGWLGESLPEVVSALLFHPLDALGAVLLEMGGGVYLALLMLPLFFVPVVGAEFLLPAAADLAVNLLSANPMPRSVFAYHSIALIPLLVAAGVKGTLRIAARGRYSPTGVGGVALWGSLLMTYLAAPLPLPGAANVWAPAEYRLWPESTPAEIRSLLPPEASLSAQSNVAPHFTQRAAIRVFPNGVGDADCVVLRLASPTLRVDGDSRDVVGTLAHHLQMSPASYLAEARGLVQSGGYGLRYWNKPWLVLCKDQALSEEARKEILRHMAGLEQAWLNGCGAAGREGAFEP